MAKWDNKKLEKDLEDIKKKSKESPPDKNAKQDNVAHEETKTKT